MARIIDSTQFCKLAGITKPTMQKWQKIGLLEKKMFNGKALYFTDKDLALVPKIKEKMRSRMATDNRPKNKNIERKQIG